MIKLIIKNIHPGGQFLRDASKMLCGKPLFAEGGQFYRVISSIEDQQKKYDERELNSLPSKLPSLF